MFHDFRGTRDPAEAFLDESKEKYRVEAAVLLVDGMG